MAQAATHAGDHLDEARFEALLLQLRDRAGQEGDVGDELERLSWRAARAGLPAAQLVRAIMATLWCFNQQLRSADAERFRVQAMAAMEPRGLPGFNALFEMLRGEMLIARGAHAEGFLALVGATRAADFARLSPTHKVRTLGMLATHCMLVDPGDPVTACLQSAKAAWPADAGLLPIDTAVWLTLPRLFQWLWTGPAFQGRLPSVRWPEERRAAVLRELQGELAALAARSDPAALMTQHWLAVYPRLVDARVANDVEAVIAAMPPQPSQTQNQLEMSYAVAGTLLDMGQGARALELVQPLLDRAESATRWELRLNLMHLKSAIAIESPRRAAALDLYVRYAAEAARQMQRMNLDVLTMLKSVTQLPGARPGDQPGVKPAYLERAQALLQEQPLGHRVSELAARVGVSDRTLRDAFNVHLGIGPKEYSTLCRLKAVHTHISSGRARNQTVAELARQFGFTHPGRFAALYRKHFGASPRELLPLEAEAAPSGPSGRNH